MISADSSPGLKLKKYSLLTWIYFFFNSVLLPKGLLYTHILSPLFFYNVHRVGGRTWLRHFVIFLSLYDLLHLILGVDLRSFVFSNALFILTYFCVVGFYHFVNHYNHPGRLFKEVVIFNAILAAIAIPFFFLPREYQQWFWYFNILTKGIADFPRLALFTYEASYYSLLLIPVLYYYLCKFFLDKFFKNKWSTLLMISLPMLLSFSFGVLGASLLALLFLCFYFRNEIFRKKRTFVVFASVVLLALVGSVLFFLLFPDNFLVIRLQNIFAGADTSTKGRTTDSFGMAWRIANERSIWFGAGLGQIKIVNIEIIQKYYNYWGVFPRYDIPNAMGETFAIFGIVGTVFRLWLELFLFFRTKVYTNYYRFALFLFIFIYQFTGSFITNVVEYLIWVLAFSQVFSQFDTDRKQISSEQSSQRSVN